MTDLVTLAEAKAWLRLTDDETHFDGELQVMIAAASEAVAEFADAWIEAGAVPSRMKVATLSRICAMFEDRSKIGPATDERGLIQPLRVLEL